MRYLLVIPLAVLLVGLGFVNGQVGFVAVLLALLLSGVLWRMLKFVTGSLMMFLSFL